MTKEYFESQLKASLENCFMLGGSGQKGDGVTKYIDKLLAMNMDNLEKLGESEKPVNPKYPNGYLPKIEYWEGQLSDAIDEDNIDNVIKCMEKLKYFKNKQAQL